MRTVKSENEEVNDVLTNIRTNDITELNDLIYAEAKLVCEKIGIFLKTTDRKLKPGWELRLESQIKRLRQQARILKRNLKKVSDEIEESWQLELKNKLEQTNQKILKTGPSKTTKKFYQQLRGEWAKPCQQPDARKVRRFWSKIWERKDYNKKAEWIKKNMETELRMLEGSP